MSEVFSYRQGVPSDTSTITTLWKGSSVMRSREEAVKARLKQYPSAVVTFSSDEPTQGRSLDIVGFAYTSPAAPEVLELENIFIHEDYRNRSLGSALLKLIEDQAVQSSYGSIIVFNSDLYGTREETKKPATGFYSKNNFALVNDTGSTRIFIKSLG